MCGVNLPEKAGCELHQRGSFELQHSFRIAGRHLTSRYGKR